MGQPARAFPKANLIPLSVRDVEFDGHEAGMRPGGVAERLKFDSNPIGGPGAMVVQDLDREASAGGQALTHSFNRGRIGFRALQEVAGLAAENFGQLIAGNAGKPLVHPLDAAFGVRHDDRVAGRRSDFRQTAEFHFELFLLGDVAGRGVHQAVFVAVGGPAQPLIRSVGAAVAVFKILDRLPRFPQSNGHLGSCDVVRVKQLDKRTGIQYLGRIT